MFGRLSVFHRTDRKSKILLKKPNRTDHILKITKPNRIFRFGRLHRFLDTPTEDHCGRRTRRCTVLILLINHVMFRLSLIVSYTYFDTIQLYMTRHEVLLIVNPSFGILKGKKTIGQCGIHPLWNKEKMYDCLQIDYRSTLCNSTT